MTLGCSHIFLRSNQGFRQGISGFFGFFGFRQGIFGGRGGLCALSCPDAGFQGGLCFSKQNLAVLKKELLEMGLSKNMHLNPISADC